LKIVLDRDNLASVGCDSVCNYKECSDFMPVLQYIPEAISSQEYHN